MLNGKNIQRFESELKKVNCPGTNKLLDYIRKSGFCSTPARALATTSPAGAAYGT